MSRTPPLEDFIYARHQRGFALAAQRNPMLSRYYVQVPNGTDIADWPDDRFCFHKRLPMPSSPVPR